MSVSSHKRSASSLSFDVDEHPIVRQKTGDSDEFDPGPLALVDMPLILTKSAEKLDEDLLTSYKRTHDGDFYSQQCSDAMFFCIQRLPNINPIYYRDHETLAQFYIDNRDGLQALWEEAQKSRTMDKFRRLNGLQYRKDELYLYTDYDVLANIPHVREVVKRAFTLPYVGITHKILYANICAMQRTMIYSTSVPIVQSSGTGKSRMVDELAKEVFTMPFCLRPREEGSYSFPYTDGKVLDCLTNSKLRSEELPIALAHYLLFFERLFRETRKKLETIGNKNSYSDLSKAWYDFLNDPDAREALYTSVVNDVEMSSSQLTLENVQGDKLNVYGNSASKELDKLLATIDLLSGSVKCIDTNVKAVIYFDEAHALFRTEPVSDLQGIKRVVSKSLYDMLCSTLNFFLKSSLFTIFLSTNSNISQLAHTARTYPSARVIMSAKLQPPITEVPFDQHPEIYVKDSFLNHEDVYNLDFMAKFGRPLFWTYIVSARVRGGDKSEDILPMVMSKLIQAPFESVTWSSITRTAKFAILDNRLMIYISTRLDTAFREEAKLVASHMRLAYSVPSSREVVRSGYSSEPLLAEGAAQLMARLFADSDDSAKRTKILDSLAEFMQDGIVDKGATGELLARLLLVFAYDKAVEMDHQGTEFTEKKPFYSRGCRVTSFLEALITSNYIGQIFSRQPDNVLSNESLQEAFKDARVRFTHFVKAGDDIMVSTAAMFAAYVRGMAIICHDTQYAIDLVLPVLLKDPIGQQNMTSIMIQVRMRSKATLLRKLTIDAEKLGFFPKTSTDARPYITLVMELGIKRTRSDIAKTPRLVNRAPKAPAAEKDDKPPKNRSARPAKAPKIRSAIPAKVIFPKRSKNILDDNFIRHPRYSIIIRGWTGAVYNGVETAHLENFANLTRARDLLDEHPRQDVDSVAILRSMKPFWSVGESCFKWIESDLLLNGYPIEEDLTPEITLREYAAPTPDSDPKSANDVDMDEEDEEDEDDEEDEEDEDDEEDEEDEDDKDDEEEDEDDKDDEEEDEEDEELAMQL